MNRLLTGLLGTFTLCIGLATQLFAADVTPATTAEVEYWRTLQAEIAELRAGNGNTGTKMLFQQPLPEINATMARVEDFLDLRDEDEIDDLGPDLIEYREQLNAMLDSALNPIRAAAKLKEAQGSVNVQERMVQTTRYLANMRLVDEFKYDLASLHERINARIVAAGGPRIFFFQNINIGDEAVLKSTKQSPLERDKQFVEESTAIDPGFGALVEEKFLSWRRDGRIDQELEAKRDQILDEIAGVRKNTANMSNAALEKELSNLPQDDVTVRAVVGAAIRIELLHRKKQSAAALIFLDWKTAFARWLGKATDDTSIWEACRDVAATADGSRYAYCSDGKTVVVRSVDQNGITAKTTFEGDVRGLAYGANNQLLVFTTRGLFEWADQENRAPQMRNETVSPNISGRVVTATETNRAFYVWANLPELSDNGRTSTLRVSGSSSISSLAMDNSGKHVAIGYTGQDNLANGDKVSTGVNVLALPEDMGDGKISSTKFNPPYIETVTSIAFDADATNMAMATADDGRGTIAVFNVAEGHKSRRLFALDNQPYHYIDFIAGETPQVIAASKNGLVRVWDFATKELLQRFPVPTGPQGVAIGLVGDKLISVALGSESIVSWDLNNIAQPVVVAGSAPKIDNAAIAAAIETERALRPTQEKLAAFIAADGAEDDRIGRELLKNNAKELELLDRTRTVQVVVGNGIADQINALYKAKKGAEGVKIGRQAIADGFATRSVYYELIYCLRATSQMREATKLTETGLNLFPTSRDMRYLYHLQRMENFIAAKQVDAAMKEIDEIGNIYPNDRPNSKLRKNVFLGIASTAQKKGNDAVALDHYIKALDHCRTKEEQLKLMPTLFGLAYGLKNWNLTVNIANMWMNIDPNKKNDQQFMQWARYAYSQAQK